MKKLITGAFVAVIAGVLALTWELSQDHRKAYGIAEGLLLTGYCLWFGHCQDCGHDLHRDDWLRVSCSNPSCDFLKSTSTIRSEAIASASRG